MDGSKDNPEGPTPKKNNNVENNASKRKQKARTSKRKRVDSGSSSYSETELPDNILEIEKYVHASAVKNNIDEIGVRKILKKVVTNDRVLALVKLREEKELSSNDGNLPTKLTRSKVKELMKVSPKTSAWNLELTPIKHIPVKTRPEVKALIAQDLPEDEDDDEYQPTQEDVPSDDEQTLESCSDVESQPRTPATPSTPSAPSTPAAGPAAPAAAPGTPLDPNLATPKVVKDGPFKVPQNIAATKRKLDLDEEEATIARRTRSKLSLSSTSIEHIESTFVPPDDIPMPDVDDLWNQFLNECLNPASTSRNEDDDEADPEYNVAADADAVDDDEDNLSKSIIKISKKELNDLVTELFAVMPELPDVDNQDQPDNLVNAVMPRDHGQSKVPHWDGKQETPSDEDAADNVVPDKSQSENDNTYKRFSFGKTEPEDIQPEDDNDQNDTTVERIDQNIKNGDEDLCQNDQNLSQNDQNLSQNGQNLSQTDTNLSQNHQSLSQNDQQLSQADQNLSQNREKLNPNNDIVEEKHEEVIIIEIKEEERDTQAGNNVQSCVMLTTTVEEVTEAPPSDAVPPLLQNHINKKQHPPETQVVRIHIDPQFTMLPEQVLIFQQQLRQHIQMATFNFLQLYVNPVHWSYAPSYKEYLQSFVKMCKSNPKSVVNVCNLSAAFELVSSWENTTAAKTPENEKMVKFIEAELEKCRHRNVSNPSLTGEFPEQLKRVVSASSVFVYPHLLPHAPYKPDHVKRFTYIAPEDELIALGLHQFWEHVERNKAVFKPRARPAAPQRRVGLAAAVELLTAHMLPWMSARHVLCHINHVRKHGHSRNPINKLFKENKVEPVKHKLLPFNPQMTLYEHPESEIPRPWLRYLAKTSNRFRKHITRTDNLIQPTTGVPVEMGKAVEVPTKNPLPIDFNQAVTGAPVALPKTSVVDKDENPKKDVFVATNLFSVVQTSAGMVLVPLMVPETNVTNSQNGTITTPAEIQSTNVPNTTQQKDSIEVRVIDKPIEKSKTIPGNNLNDHCECCVTLRRICREVKLITDYFKPTINLRKECQCRDRKFPKISNRLKVFLNIFKSHSQVMLKEIEDKLKGDVQDECRSDADDLEYAVLYKMKLLACFCVKINRMSIRKRLYSLFSEFNTATDDPVKLAQKVHDCVKANLIYVYNEFLGFLTAEQAENVGVFDHYFISHIKPLMKKIEEDISDVERRKTVLTRLKVFFDNSTKSSTCEMCKSILLELKDYPRLAKYVFSLFPHKKCTQRDVTLQRIQIDSETPTPPVESASTNQQEEMLLSDDEDSSDSAPIVDTCTVEQSEPVVVKTEPPPEETLLSVVRSIASNADEESRGSPDNSMVIAEGEIKAERQEWTREEDKVLLEIIKKYLASEESKNKSIYTILEDDKVYQLISEHMTDKGMDDIVQRVLYLLEVLVGKRQLT